MVSQRDAYICDVIVIAQQTEAGNLAGLADRLKAHGMQVRDVHEGSGYIEATVDAGKLRPMEEVPGVRYVRCVYSYIADYPPGDARDGAAAHRPA